jgi:hypothetical protein
LEEAYHLLSINSKKPSTLPNREGRVRAFKENLIIVWFRVLRPGPGPPGQEILAILL